LGFNITSANVTDSKYLRDSKPVFSALALLASATGLTTQDEMPDLTIRGHTRKISDNIMAWSPISNTNGSFSASHNDFSSFLRCELLNSDKS
jgi:hypothetical protein